jgi:NAD(P)-dependent dehydrogenase (short-subunit alcohol dehydrogenase family)
VSEPERVAVVTGANRGIGRAIAVALAMSGFAVLATARDPASLQDTVTEIERAGGAVSTAACDVREEASVAAMAETALTWGPVHTVVANAGTTGPTRPLHEISLDEWRDCVATNLDGVFLTFRAFIPSMITAGRGSLIAISSMTGKRPLTNRTPYAAAKMGVIGLARTLATELGGYGIRVNAICPGAVAGPRIEDVVRKQAAARGTTDGEALKAFTGSSPLGRLVEPGEVARACAFLASDDAASITGEDMNVTAGVVMY